MLRDDPISRDALARMPSEVEVIEIVKRVLQAREDQRDMQQVSPQELQKAVLEIRDAIKQQANAISELTSAIQLAASRGSSGVGGF